MTAEQNYRLLRELEENRRFMLLAYRDNPRLLAKAEERIQRLFIPNRTDTVASDQIIGRDNQVIVE